MNKKKGYTLLETLISMLMLSCISLALASFISQTMNVSYTNSQQLEKIDFTRFTVERLISEVKKAEYIYPSNVNLTLLTKDPADLTKTKTYTINTSNAVALLIPADKTNLKYRFTTFFIEEIKIKNPNYSPNNPSSVEFFTSYNLNEFNSTNTYTWSANSIPAESFLTVNGSSQLIATNLDNNYCTLSYVLNNANGLSDYSLKGDAASTLATSTKALITGMKWNLKVNINGNEEIIVNGLSNNIPRFIEQ